MFLPSMNRRPSLLLRLTRAFVGFVTVWCLGCFAYEPIVDSLRGSGVVSTMDCGARQALESGQVASVSVGAAIAATSVSATPCESGFDCGCGGICHAVSLSYQALTVAQMTVPVEAHDLPTEPASVTRSPLLPPPQRTA